MTSNDVQATTLHLLEHATRLANRSMSPSSPGPPSGDSSLLTIKEGATPPPPAAAAPSPSISRPVSEAPARSLRDSSASGSVEARLPALFDMLEKWGTERAPSEQQQQQQPDLSPVAGAASPAGSGETEAAEGGSLQPETQPCRTNAVCREQTQTPVDTASPPASDRGSGPGQARASNADSTGREGGSAASSHVDGSPPPPCTPSPHRRQPAHAPSVDSTTPSTERTPPQASRKATANGAAREGQDSSSPSPASAAGSPPAHTLSSGRYPASHGAAGSVPAAERTGPEGSREAVSLNTHACLASAERLLRQIEASASPSSARPASLPQGEGGGSPLGEPACRYTSFNKEAAETEARRCQEEERLQRSSQKASAAQETGGRAASRSLREQLAFHQKELTRLEDARRSSLEEQRARSLGSSRSRSEREGCPLAAPGTFPSAAAGWDKREQNASRSSPGACEPEETPKTTRDLYLQALNDCAGVGAGGGPDLSATFPQQQQRQQQPSCLVPFPTRESELRALAQAHKALFPAAGDRTKDARSASVGENPAAKANRSSGTERRQSPTSAETVACKKAGRSRSPTTEGSWSSRTEQPRSLTTEQTRSPTKEETRSSETEQNRSPSTEQNMSRTEQNRSPRREQNMSRTEQNRSPRTEQNQSAEQNVSRTQQTQSPKTEQSRSPRTEVNRSPRTEQSRSSRTDEHRSPRDAKQRRAGGDGGDPDSPWQADGRRHAARKGVGGASPEHSGEARRQGPACQKQDEAGERCHQNPAAPLRGDDHGSQSNPSRVQSSGQATKPARPGQTGSPTRAHSAKPPGSTDQNPAAPLRGDDHGSQGNPSRMQSSGQATKPAARPGQTASPTRSHSAKPPGSAGGRRTASSRPRRASNTSSPSDSPSPPRASPRPAAAGQPVGTRGGGSYQSLHSTGTAMPPAKQARSPSKPAGDAARRPVASEAAREHLEQLRGTTTERHKQETASLSKKMIAAADALHAQRALLRRIQAEVETVAKTMEPESTVETDCQVATLRAQKDEVHRQYKHGLTLQVKQRQAQRLRLAKSTTKRREELDREVADATRGLVNGQKILPSLRRRCAECEERVRGLKGEAAPHVKNAQQLDACQQKLAWLASAFSVETSIADLSVRNQQAADAFKDERDRLVENIKQLEQLQADLQNAKLSDVVAHQAKDLMSLRQEARLDSTELRCRQAAEITWRDFLATRTTLTISQALMYCDQLRSDPPGSSAGHRSPGPASQEDSIKRKMEALGAAEVVSSWAAEYQRQHDGELVVAETDVYEDLAAFIEAVSAQSETIQTQLQAKLQQVEQRTATLGRLVDVEGETEIQSVAEELAAAEHELQQLQKREQIRVARADRRRQDLIDAAEARKASRAGDRALHGPLDGSGDDWQTVLYVGTTEERAAFIACLLRAKSILTEQIQMWDSAEDGAGLAVFPGKIDTAERELAEARDLVRKTEETIRSETRRVARMKAELDELCTPDTPGDYEQQSAADDGADSLKLLRQMLDSIDEEISASQHAARDAAEKQVRARNARQRDLLAKLSAVKAEVRNLVRGEKDLERQMTLLKQSHRLELSDLTTAAALQGKNDTTCTSATTATTTVGMPASAAASACDSPKAPCNTGATREVSGYASLHARGGNPGGQRAHAAGGILTPPRPSDEGGDGEANKENVRPFGGKQPPGPPRREAACPSAEELEGQIEEVVATFTASFQAGAAGVAHPDGNVRGRAPSSSARPGPRLHSAPTSAKLPSRAAHPDSAPDDVPTHQNQQLLQAADGDQGLPAEVQLFGPSSAAMPLDAALAELRRVQRLVQQGTPVWKKVRNAWGRKTMRLAADLSRTEVRKEGKKVAEDFMRSEHLVKVFRSVSGSTSSAGPKGFPFIIQLRDTRVEFLADNAQDASDWLSVLGMLVKYRSLLFFLKYNMRHLLR
ncbi:hypothetical protein DIPPA_35884 [Diplonema papillatum]|nr:hypothetical protein DIPPA_35884 [Diplonema papillatum]